MDPALIQAAKHDPRVRHDLTAGEFLVEDETPADAPPIVVEGIDDAAAAALADELKLMMRDAKR